MVPRPRGGLINVPGWDRWQRPLSSLRGFASSCAAARRPTGAMRMSTSAAAPRALRRNSRAQAPRRLSAGPFFGAGRRRAVFRLFGGTISAAPRIPAHHLAEKGWLPRGARAPAQCVRLDLPTLCRRATRSVRCAATTEAREKTASKPDRHAASVVAARAQEQSTERQMKATYISLAPTIPRAASSPPRREETVSQQRHDGARFQPPVASAANSRSPPMARIGSQSRASTFALTYCSARIRSDLLASVRVTSLVFSRNERRLLRPCLRNEHQLVAVASRRDRRGGREPRPTSARCARPRAHRRDLDVLSKISSSRRSQAVRDTPMSSCSR